MTDIYAQREQLIEQLNTATTDEDRCTIHEEIAGIDSELREQEMLNPRLSQEDERKLLYFDYMERLE